MTVNVLHVDMLGYSRTCLFSTVALRYRLLGLSMAMAIGPLAEVSAYAFAPQSLLAPLDGFDVIWNILPWTQLLVQDATFGKKGSFGNLSTESGWRRTLWVKVLAARR